MAGPYPRRRAGGLELADDSNSIHGDVTMSIRVDIQTGHASGATHDFDSGVVLIGRGPECQVKLHPTKDTQVSRTAHARLHLRPDGWWLECCHDSGVKVVSGPDAGCFLRDGERVGIDDTTEFELSPGGPRISVVPTDMPLPVTDRNEHGGAPLPVSRVVPEELTKHGRQSKRWVAVVAVVVVLLAAVGWIVSSSLSGRTSEAEAKLTKLESASSEQIAALRSAVDQIKPGSSAALATALRQAAASVWVVGSMDKDGVFTPVGTAWAVSRTQLATNAHVAEALREHREQGIPVISGGKIVRRIPVGRLVARRNGSADPELTLRDTVEVHPGYGEWESRFGEQFQSAAGNRTRSVGFVPACDVALLPIASGDPGRPLPLASKNNLTMLAAAPVGYVGFPMEGVAGVPSQQTVTGVVTNQTDFFCQPSPAEDAQLIHHNAVSVGGASGSPLLNERGEVVGLVSAGSVVGVAERGRIPIGLNYAQRVDVLQELLAGKADEQQQARSARWASVASTLLKPYHEVIGPLAGRDLLLTLRTSLERRLGRPLTQQDAGSLDAVSQSDSMRFKIVRGGIEGAARLTVPIPEGVAVGFGAAGDGFPNLRIAVVIDKDTNDLPNSGSWTWCPCVSLLPSTHARQAEVFVWTDRDPLAPIDAVMVVCQHKSK